MLYFKYSKKHHILWPSVLSAWFRLRGLDNVPGSEHLIGFSESLPVRGAWRPNGVACGGSDRRALLLAAADGCGTARGRDGSHNQTHT